MKILTQTVLLFALLISCAPGKNDQQKNARTEEQKNIQISSSFYGNYYPQDFIYGVSNLRTIQGPLWELKKNPKVISIDANGVSIGWADFSQKTAVVLESKKDESKFGIVVESKKSNLSFDNGYVVVSLTPYTKYIKIDGDLGKFLTHEMFLGRSYENSSYKIKEVDGVIFMNSKQFTVTLKESLNVNLDVMSNGTTNFYFSLGNTLNIYREIEKKFDANRILYEPDYDNVEKLNEIGNSN